MIDKFGGFFSGKSKGVPGTRAPIGGCPNSFIFMQFRPKNRLAHPLWELTRPKENPRSATVFVRILVTIEYTLHTALEGSTGF